MSEMTIPARLTAYLSERVETCLSSIELAESYSTDEREAQAQAADLELERIATPFLLSVLVELLERRGRVDASTG